MKTYFTCESSNTQHGKWYCSLCDKNNMNVKSKNGLLISIFHKCRERFALTVKKYECNPEIIQTDNILKDGIKDCQEKYFHTFEQRCKYDKKFKHMTPSEVFHFKITNGFKLFSIQSDRLHEKVGEYQKIRIQTRCNKKQQ